MKLKTFIFKVFRKLGLLNSLSDEKYVKLAYNSIFDKPLNLNNPQTFNEKLQWLKLYDRQSIYTTMVDKHAVKDYVANIIGKEYIIPTLGVYDKFEDIDFSKLPNQFVLKCTHDSGGLVIVKDKSKLDIKKAKKKINRCLKCNYYYRNREWPYKNVKPRIIAEKYMVDSTNDYLPVYKFFCFDGKPMIIQAIQNDKQPNETIDYFDINWNLLSLKQNFPNSKTHLIKPKLLDEMLLLCQKLSKGHSFIRVDLYSINEKIYFSEFTFFSDGGLMPFEPKEWDKKLGDYIVLPKKTN